MTNTSASPTIRLPDAVELCARDKDGQPCLGIIHRIESLGRIYCVRCGGTTPGVVYRRYAVAPTGAS